MLRRRQSEQPRIKLIFAGLFAAQGCSYKNGVNSKYRFSYRKIHDIRLLSSYRVLVTLRRFRCARDPLSRCVAQ